MASRALATLVATALLLIAVGVAPRAQDQLDPRIVAYDKGPATIDVSKYPADMQAKYRVFAGKCAKCHTLARPINSEFVLDDEWERYIKRMMRKPGSGITATDGKSVFEFLAYDSKVRKKALFDRRSKETR